MFSLVVVLPRTLAAPPAPVQTFAAMAREARPRRRPPTDPDRRALPASIRAARRRRQDAGARPAAARDGSRETPAPCRGPG